MLLLNGISMALALLISRYLLLIGLVLPAANTDPPKDAEKKPSATEKTETKPKMVAVGDITGKLIRVDSGQKSLSVEVEIRYRNGKNIESKGVPVEVVADDDVKVRVAYPPVEYDAKGNLKKYTSQELRALKGSGNQWGYPGDFDSLKTEQIVRVILMRPKDASKTSPNAKKGEAPAQPRAVATTIYILQAAPK